MCKKCKIVEDGFKSASSNPHSNLVPVYKMLDSLLQQGRISIYAGDCKFVDMLTELSKEQHFTVCFYLESDICFCKNMYKDNSMGRFGAKTGDKTIRLFRKEECNNENC